MRRGREFAPEIEYYAPTDLVDDAHDRSFATLAINTTSGACAAVGGPSSQPWRRRGSSAHGQKQETSGSQTTCEAEDSERIYHEPQIVSGATLPNFVHSLPFRYHRDGESRERNASGEQPCRPHPPPPPPFPPSLPVHSTPREGAPPPVSLAKSLHRARSWSHSQPVDEHTSQQRQAFSAGKVQAGEKTKKLKLGTLLILHRGVYDHWAVYVGNGQVVHLAGEEELRTRKQSAREVLRSLLGGTDYPGVHLDTLDNVRRSGAISFGDDLEEHAFLGRAFPPQAIVERSLSLVGLRGYHLKYNNCEHFATWARYGRGFSDQSGKWFKPLPQGSDSAESRSRIDKITRCHLLTGRQSWVAIATDPICLKRLKFLGSLSSFQALRDVGLRVKKSFSGVVKAHESSEDSQAPTLGILAASTQGWIATYRSNVADFAGRCVTSPIKTRLFNESDIEATVSAVVEFGQRQLSNGYAIRQICAQGCAVAVVTGQLQAGEDTVNLHVAESVDELAAHARRSWERQSYIYSCTYFNGYWLALSSDGVRLDNQALLQSSDFSGVREKIAPLYESGYLASCVAAGPVWVVLMDKSAHTIRCRQEIFVATPGEPFPAEHLQKMWNQGLILTAATGN